MKHNIESSLKRFLKRKVKITMGFVVAFLITGTVGFAEADYYAKDKEVSVEKAEDITAKVNTSVSAENNNRFTAIGAENKHKIDLTTTGNINIVNDPTVTNSERLYGIVLNGGATGNITANEINFNVTAPKDNVRVVGIRNNSIYKNGNGLDGTLTINSNITGTLVNTGEDLIGIESWYGTETVINGDVNLTLKKNGSGYLYAVRNFENEGKNLTFNKTATFNIETGENYSGKIGAIRANQGTTDFNKNTNITITNNSNIGTEEISLVDISCDYSDEHETLVNFKGDLTVLNYVGTGKSNSAMTGVSASGSKGYINFNGKEAIIDVTTDNSSAVMALNAQYGGHVTSLAGTKLSLNVINNSSDSNSNTYGIYSSQHAGYNGNVILNGSVDIITQANAGFSGGIVNIADPDVVDENDGKVLVGKDLSISATSKTGQAIGVYTTGKYGETTLNGDTNINVNGNSGAFGISAKNGGTVSATGKNISIAATSTGGNATAVEANNGTGTGGEVVKLGGENTENIVLKANGKNFATGIEVVNHNPKDGQKIAGSKVEVNSKNLIIDVHSSDSEAAGIWVQNSTLKEGSTDKIANVVVNSENTVINVTSDTKGNALGLVAMSQGKLEVNGNLEVNAETAILTRGNAVTTINKNKDKTVKLNGDIEFNYDKPTSGTPVDATVDLNLSNAESFFKGKIVVTGEGIPENYEKVSNMNLGLSNKATWENTGDSFVSNLDLNNGIINNTSVENDISVGTLKGNGGDINLVAEIEANGTATSGKLAIDKVDNKDAKFNVNYSGEGNLEVSQEEAKDIFDDLAGKITVENGQFNANAKIEEGLISGEHTAEFVKGQGNEVVVKPNTVTTGSNSMVEGMRDLATINVLSWRQEMSSLNERMGELRNSTGSNGVWARVYGGKVENGSKYDNEYQTYQVGYDKKYPVENGDLFVGALVSYTDGKTDYNLGDGENYSVGAGIYATWLNRDGQFADVVLKQSRLHNKFDVRSKNGNLSQHGDYSNWGTSLSGQYGRRFDLDDKFFVEPSVQLTFGRVSSEDYTTSAGVKVEQDTAYTLVGDVGTAVGYKFSDKGNVYARASLVKEFKGDIDTKYSYGGKSEYTSEDLSDTWGEFGVGVNYRIRENVNMYVDIQRTEEATVENKWQANLGFRWEF
ncbi:autotransporter outer membrane beta-barrel domain-containing protein [uncultured Fusobacterium sp.]|uniref:autotransporter outer membrane beta-barrel domain-containing protein n=1 Tax=uncultured Fusobacterium sp. TaxID=159267 RepID=UPI0025D57D08|nr:autotransporter outer membrane beta-barrel domain-containing protein [uncultured Fusobacterium sp.]